MNIFGEKVLLRAIEPEDNKMLLELINDPDTEKMLGGKSFPVSFFNQQKWYESCRNTSDTLRVIITDKSNSNAVGTVILSDIDLQNGTAQIHLKLLSEYRGKGYGSDSIKTLVHYAFTQMRLNCIFAEILEYNAASVKLFEKCGFSKEGILRSRVYKEGRYINLLSYSIIKE